MQFCKAGNTFLSYFWYHVFIFPYLELLIIEIGFHLPWWKDLIPDKKSAQGLCGIWYEQWHRSSNASQRFFDNPSHDKLYCRRLAVICSVHSLLVKTRRAVCVLSLISALSLFCSSTVTPGFFSLHTPHPLKSPDNARKKGNNICLSAYFYEYISKK